MTVEVEGVRVSLFVCYDLRFADDWWAVAPATDAYLCVANWPDTRRHHWQALLRGPGGREPGLRRSPATGWAGAASSTYAGDSAIVDPMGEVLASGTEALLVADVDPARVAAVAEFPFLATAATGHQLGPALGDVAGGPSAASTSGWTRTAAT